MAFFCLNLPFSPQYFYCLTGVSCDGKEDLLLLHTLSLVSARFMLICWLFLETCAHREHASAQTLSLTDLQYNQYPPGPRTLPFVTYCYPQGTVGDLFDISKLLWGVSSPSLAILLVGTVWQTQK